MLLLTKSDPGAGSTGFAQGGIAAAVGPRPDTIASTSALRKRSTTSMKPIEGISSSNAVIDAIW